MSVLSRITRLFKADIHGVMDQFEDKELLIKQYLREMENNLQSKEIKLQHLIDDIRTHENKQADALKEIDKLEEDLDLAIRKDKDDIAKMLIRKQRAQKIIHHNLERQHKELREKKEKLSSQLEEQRLKYESFKAKAAAYSHRPENDHFDQEDNVFTTSDNSLIIDDNEVELELIRRKEMLQKEGGAS